jgi:hypothetical protein
VQLEPTDNGVNVDVPDSAKPDDRIQVIAEATDNGTPALTRYAKVMIIVVK